MTWDPKAELLLARMLPYVEHVAEDGEMFSERVEARRVIAEYQAHLDEPQYVPQPQRHIEVTPCFDCGSKRYAVAYCPGCQRFIDCLPDDEPQRDSTNRNPEEES